MQALPSLDDVVLTVFFMVCVVWRRSETDEARMDAFLQRLATPVPESENATEDPESSRFKERS